MSFGVGVGVAKQVQRRLYPENMKAKWALSDSIAEMLSGSRMTCTFPAENGKFYARGKRYLVAGPDVPRYGDDWIEICRGFTNLTACRHLNPSDTTGLTVSSGTKGVVSDGSGLAAGIDGWDFSRFGPSVFEVALPVTGDVCTIDGATATTDPHSFRAVAMVVSGGAAISLGSSGGAVAIGNEYAMVEAEDITPGVGDKLTITAVADGTVVRFVMPQLTETHTNMPPAGTEDAGPTSFASEAGATDNGLTADLLGKFQTIKALLEGPEGALWLDWYPDADEYTTGGLDGLLAFNDITTFGVFLSGGSGSIQGGFFDSGWLSAPYGAYAKNEKVRIGLCWQDGNAWLVVNGTPGTVKTYTPGTIIGPMIFSKLSDRWMRYRVLAFSSVAEVPDV